MPQKALVFFPTNIYPPHAGNQKRCVSILAALKDLGYEITLASTDFRSAAPWSDESILALKERCVKDVQIYATTWLDYKRTGLRERLDPLLRISEKSPYLQDLPPRMCAWFRRLIDRTAPDLLVMNYAGGDALIDHDRTGHATTVMETIDLVTVNRAMWQHINRRMPPAPIGAATVDEECIDPVRFAEVGFPADDREYRIYNRYTHTIAISEQEAGLIAEHAPRTRSHFVPMTQSVRPLQNSYCGPALFPTGPNPFNLQGYLYFARYVLPLVRRQTPDFTLQMTGWCSELVVKQEGVELSGYVPDIEAVYRDARFVVCPVFGGTGQQVKIVEAMAMGLPVVALAGAARRSPILNEVNGLVASDAGEFASHIQRLWGDPSLCRRLGDAARQTIEEQCSPKRLLAALSEMLR